MAMSKAELQNAFREAASYEFREIPQDDSQIQYDFSAAFESRMDKIIKKDRTFFWKFVNTASKRVAVIAVVCMALILTACSVPAIREPIVRFIVEVFSDHNAIYFEGNITETISKEYEMTFVPDGYVLTDSLSDDTGFSKTYENENKQIIRFSQVVTDGTDITIDNERGVQKSIDIAGNETLLYLREDISIAIWCEDSYMFKIVYHGYVTEDLLIKLVESVE